MRDYEQWHARYDDPESDLSWRLRTVRRLINDALDRQQGRMRILSSCAGDGRDVLGVLGNRDDAHRFDVTLLEAHPQIAERARVRATALPFTSVDVRTVDAGNTEAYVGAVPAEVVLMVGILGNISDVDLWQTVAAMPQFCRPGGTLLWSRSRAESDRNGEVRERLAAAGFVELEYTTIETGSRPALAAMRYNGPLQPLVPGRHLFTFLR